VAPVTVIVAPPVVPERLTTLSLVSFVVPVRRSVAAVELLPMEIVLFCPRELFPPVFPREEA